MSLRDVNEQIALEDAAYAKHSAKEYKGWTISWDYGQYEAISPNYDAWTEGEGEWVDNGQRVFARTHEDLIAEIDAWIEEHEA